MSKIFSTLVNYGLIDDYAEIIDWLQEDSKFEKWDKNRKSSLTKKIKNYIRTNKIVLEEKEITNIPKRECIYIRSNNSWSVDLLKKIRNIISHQNAKICKQKKEYYISGIYKKNNVEIVLNVPLIFLKECHKLFKKTSKE